MKAKRILAAVLTVVMLLSMSAFTFADNEIESAEQNVVEIDDSTIQDINITEADTAAAGDAAAEAEEPEGAEDSVVETVAPLEVAEEDQSEIDLENVEIAEEVEAVSVSEVDDVDAAETEESSDEAIAEISEFFVGFDGAASDVVYKDGTYTVTASVTPDEDEEFDAYSGTVTVVVKDGEITAVSFDGDYDEDNDTYVGYALNGRTRKGTTYASIPSQIIAANSAEGIDAVSGATCVSNAIVETVAVILNGDAAADPAPSDGYVLMNIPYAAFYAAEGVSGVDAVTTATVKTYNQTMAGGSYHSGYVTEDASTGVILGVTYPVYVADMSVLTDLTEVKAEDTATITVAAGKSALTTKEVTGADLLFGLGDDLGLLLVFHAELALLGDILALYQGLVLELLQTVGQRHGGNLLMFFCSRRGLSPLARGGADCPSREKLLWPPSPWACRPDCPNKTPPPPHQGSAPGSGGAFPPPGS